MTPPLDNPPPSAQQSAAPNRLSGEQIARELRETMAERILLLDGGIGTRIQTLELSEQAYRGDRVFAR